MNGFLMKPGIVTLVFGGLVIAGFAGPCSQSAIAGDWPQILGPHRNGETDNESLADSWPSEGPPTVWQRPVGRGYAGLAVVGTTGVLFHRVGNEEIVEAIDSRTGKANWKSALPTSYVSGISPDDGPRCVPVIHVDTTTADGKSKGNRVIVFGVQGQLACFGLADGHKIWARDTLGEFGASEGYFGAGSTPIVEGGNVIVNVGGAKQGAGVVAFSLETGEPVWKTSKEEASYSSPVAATVAGTRHLIVETRLATLSLDPANGAIRFRIPFGQRGPTVNGANPSVIGDRLFLTASYGIGGLYAKIRDSAAEQLWESDDVLSSQYTTCVRDGNVLYGIHGRDDVGRAKLRCIDPEKQKVLWEREGFGCGTLLKADGKIVALKTDGTLVLLRCDPARYAELASAPIFNTKAYALPALAAVRLFLRDEQTLKCLNLQR